MTTTRALDLSGKRVLVVGGSSGIGRGVVTGTAALGARVAVVARRAHLLKELADEAGAATITADLAESADCARIAEETLATIGAPDAVLLCAAVSPLSRIADTPAEVWQRLMSTNAIGPALVTGALLPHLPRGALIAHVSSRSVGHPYHGVGPYSASKAALDQAMLAYRTENPELRFTRIEVGDTAGTDFNREFDLSMRDDLGPAWVAHGALSARLLDCADISDTITDSLATLLARPGVTAHNLVFHAPGGVLAPGARPTVGAADAEVSVGRGGKAM